MKPLDTWRTVPSHSAGQKRIFGVLSSLERHRNILHTPWLAVCVLPTVLSPTSVEAPPEAEASDIGLFPSLSIPKVRKERPTCLRLLVQLMRCALALARARAGSNKAARMAMMAITTNNSIRVKAPIFLRMFFIFFTGFYYCFGKQTANNTDAVHAVNPMLSIPLAMRMPAALCGKNLRKSHTPSA